MTKIIFATSNQGKVREIKEIIKETGADIEVLSLKEAGITTEIIEDGTTFEENALIKARVICKETGLLTLSAIRKYMN